MKKFLSLLIAIVLLQSSTVSIVYAMDKQLDFDVNSTNTTKSTEIEKLAINNILEFVAIEKGSVGLEKANFENLCIGNKIFRYIITENGIEQIGFSYPIIYKNEIVLMATYGLDGELQISEYEAQAINNSKSQYLAIIYAADAMYLYNGTEWELVTTYDELIANRITLQEYLTLSDHRSFDNITIADISKYESLGYHDVTYKNAIDDYYSCTVDFVWQNFDYDCWAVCVAMVANYMTNTEYDALDIFNEYNYDQYSAPDPTEIAEILRDDYSCGEYWYSPNYPSDSTIMTSVLNYCPIVDCFTIAGASATDPGHVGVIDAIHTSAGYIKVCDPESGRIYTYKNQSEDQPYYGQYTYVSPSSGSLLILHGQVAVDS